MDSRICALFACLAVAGVAVAAKPGKVKQQLTPQRITEFSGPGPAAEAARYTVQIDGLETPGPIAFERTGPPRTAVGPVRVSFSTDKPGVIEVIRECRYPIAFDPPQAAAETGDAITPVTPKAFETTNAGWTIHLTAKPAGKLIAVSGTADFVEVVMMNGGYGAVAGPIHNVKGELISPNVVHQPKTTTTSTRFHIFALPGEPYEVTLYRGERAEKHIVTVSTE